MITEILENYKVSEYENSNIYVIENIFEDELCENIIDIIDKTSLKKTDYEKGNNVRCYCSEMDLLLKTDDYSYYKFPTDTIEYKKMLENIKNKNSQGSSGSQLLTQKMTSSSDELGITTNNLGGLTNEYVKTIFEKINNKMKIINEIMKMKNENLKMDFNVGYTLRKIFGATRSHVDGINQVYHSNIVSISENYLKEYRMVRNATIIFSLNNNYDGGIFNFPGKNVSLKLEKGSVLIFPPYWTHPHEVSDLTNDSYRYTLSTWTCNSL